MLSAIAALICGLLLASQQQAQVEPFIPIGIWYAGGSVRPPAAAATDLDTVRSELALIRSGGFNSITTWVNWRDAEPRPGSYALAAVERLIAAAAQNDLTVNVRLFTDKPPAWSSAVPTDRARFITYVASRLRLGPQVTSVEPADGPDDLGKTIRVGRNARTPFEARMDFWAAVAAGAKSVTFADVEGGAGVSVLSLGETVGIVTWNQALFAPLRPRKGGVRDVVGGSGAPVDVKMLESAEVLVIIGVNYSPSVQRVTINFTPEIPEAIWQNLETSTSVNFVMGRGGPFLEHTFSPRDTLVLMIRKTLR
jgi:hypothetical protein